MFYLNASNPKNIKNSQNKNCQPFVTVARVVKLKLAFME